MILNLEIRHEISEQNVQQMISRKAETQNSENHNRTERNTARTILKTR